MHRIKGNHFNIAALLGVKPKDEKARMFMGGSVAVFRYVGKLCTEPPLTPELGWRPRTITDSTVQSMASWAT